MGAAGFGGIGGGMGYAPIDIVMRLQIVNTMLLQQLNQQLRQTQQLTTRAQSGMNGMTGSVSRGIGAFYVLSRAMRMSNMVIRTGVDAAKEWELGLVKLGLATNETGARLNRLGEIAEDVVMKVGPLWGPEMLYGMSRLASTIGGSTGRAAALAEPFGKLITNMATVSGGAVSPTGAAEMTGRVINLFGGRDPSAIMELWQKYTGAFFQTDPSKLETTLRKIAPMAALGMPAEQIFRLSTLAGLAPTSARGGSDVRRFLEAVAGVGIHKRGRSAREQSEMLASLTGGLNVVFGGPGGGLNFNRVFQFLSGRTAGMSPQALEAAGQKAFPGLLPQGFFRYLAANPNILQRIEERQATMKGIEATFNTLRTTMTYSFEQLSNDLKQVAARIFTAPSTTLARIARGGANVSTGLLHDMRAVPGLASLLGGGAIALAGGTSAGVMSLFMRGLGGMAGGLGVGGSLAAGALSLASWTLLISGVIAAVITGGIELYRHSSGFKAAVDATADVFTRLTETQINFYRNMLHKIRVAAGVELDPTTVPTSFGTMRSHGAAGDIIEPMHLAQPRMMSQEAQEAVAQMAELFGKDKTPSAMHTGARNKAITSMWVERTMAQAFKQALQEMQASPKAGGVGVPGTTPFTAGFAAAVP